MTEAIFISYPQTTTHKLIIPHETLHILHQHSLVIAIDPLLK